MGLSEIFTYAPAIAVVLGLSIYVVRQNRKSIAMAARIREELGRVDSMTLPDLVEKIGLEDGFFNRGRVISTLNPMVASGEVIQEEPEGTTMANRIVSLRFRLRG